MARSWQGYQGTCHRSWQGYHGFEHWVGTKKGPFKKGLRKVALKNQIKRSNHEEFNKIALKLSYQKTEKIKLKEFIKNSIEIILSKNRKDQIKRSSIKIALKLSYQKTEKIKLKGVQ